MVINGAGRERGAIGMKNITAADLFCGGGGTSQGLILAARSAGVWIDLLAVNHWPVAVRTRELNHPTARHLCADLSSVDPSKAMEDRRLDLLVASPECTHHSIARGGKPCDDQSRASAFHVTHWAERVEPREILVENIPEFESWGPLTKRGRPNKRLKGRTFQAWVGVLRSLGYAVDWRVLNAADYGDATSRRRLFVRASKRGKITWPAAAYAGRWRGAREIIDWGLKGESIFRRRRPLKPNTLRRIEAGLKKFGGEKFIVLLRGTDSAQEGSWARSVDAPLPVISAGGVHSGLCEPFLVEYHGDKTGKDKRVKSVDDPLPVQTTENRFGLCQPFVMNVAHAGDDASRCRSVEAPLPAIPAGHRGELAFVVPMEHSGRPSMRSVADPLPTITTANGGALGLCQPFVAKYYGTGAAKSVEEPLDTVTSKDRFGLVETAGMDICFRMLQPHELGAAMGFNREYVFCGNKSDQVRQIGNAVAVGMSAALCGEILRGMI
jgi:DNA (cytosine-5)-methyltransferase 1